MTKESLAELRRLEAEATAAPWEHKPCSDYPAHGANEEELCWSVRSASGARVFRRPENRRLATALRNSARQLLDDAERLARYDEFFRREGDSVMAGLEVALEEMDDFEEEKAEAKETNEAFAALLATVPT